MKVISLIIFLLAGTVCGSPPLPPTVYGPLFNQFIVPKFEMFEPVFKPAAVGDRIAPFRYPPLDTNLVFVQWNLEESLDLTNWTTIQANVTGELTVTNTGKFRFFRVKGIGIPKMLANLP
jgi:hypothetical protein